MSDSCVPFDVELGNDGVRVSGLIERDSRGAPVITSLTVSCTTEHSMSQLVRRLRMGELIQQAVPQVPPDLSWFVPAGPPKGGRRPLTDDLLRAVAVAYLRETAYGQPSGALTRLAAEFGRPEETVRTWISRARARGWLGPGMRGCRGAEPGPRLRRATGCDTCHGAPPPGFTCDECGTTTTKEPT